MTITATLPTNAPAGSPPREWFTREVVMAAAGQSTFGRGLSYQQAGAIERFRCCSALVSATVKGTHIYRVRFERFGAEAIAYSCDCPVGRGFAFCKHCVALALALIDGAQEEPRIKAMRGYLEGLTKDELIDFVLDQADGSEVLRAELTQRGVGVYG